MTIIAGIVGALQFKSAPQACASMIEAQRKLGDEHRCIRILGPASFGRNLRRLVPEDGFDQQPLTGAGGNLLLTADIRLNRRAELGQVLGLHPSVIATLSDSDLLLVSWERWGAKCIEYLRGDFAFAVYDRRSGRLTLARSVLSAKELFLYRGPDFVAFASTTVGLAAVGGFTPHLHIARAVQFFAGLHATGGQTLFEGVEAVEQGHVVEGTPSALIARRFWALDRERGNKRSRNDLAAELRHLFEGAVQERLRRAHGGVASQISAGRDSGAVTVTAARLLASSGDTVSAFTAAPQIGFECLGARRFLVDESGVAADAARRFSNIDHHILRSGAVSSFAGVDAWHRISPFPIVDLPNFIWSRDIFRAAQGVGASLLLTGLMGNLALSAGGVHHLVDVLREDGFRAWWRRTRQFAARSTAQWPTLLNIGLGPFIPPSLYGMIRVASGRSARRSYPLKLLRAPHRRSARDAIAASEALHDFQPPKCYFDYRRDLLYTRDDSSSVAQSLWALDLRDPTADRDLVEFCFTLPPDELLGEDDPRPLFKAAFRDDLPDAVYRPPRRGLQGADWFNQFPKNLVAEEWSKSTGHDHVRDLFDVAAVGKLIAHWPTTGWGNWEQNLFYRNDVLGAVSLANFIRHRF